MLVSETDVCLFIVGETRLDERNVNRQISQVESSSDGQAVKIMSRFE